MPRSFLALLATVLIGTCGGARSIGWGKLLLCGSQPCGSQTPGEDVLCCCRSAHSSLCRPFDGEANSGECPSKHGYIDWRKALGEDALLPEECTVEAEKSREKPKNVTIKVFWMRHGVSCANLVGWQGMPPMKQRLRYAHLKGEFRRLQEGLSEEPGLSDVAVARAKVLGTIIRAKLKKRYGKAAESIAVFSSMMIRAMESALLNFPGTDVRPLPYLAESSDWMCNKPVAWECQKQRMSNTSLGEYNVSRVVFDLCEPEHPHRYGKQSRHDYGMFRKFFPSFFEAYLAGKGAEIKEGDEIPVVIASHSEYMYEHIDDCRSRFGRWPYNNEVWSQTYSVQLGARDQEIEPVGGCEVLEPEVPDLFPPRGLDVFCNGDILRCPEIKKKVKDWLKHDREKCDAIGNKGILARDWAANMSYTKEFERMKAAGEISAEEVKECEELRDFSVAKRRKLKQNSGDIVETMMVQNMK